MVATISLVGINGSFQGGCWFPLVATKLQCAGKLETILSPPRTGHTQGVKHHTTLSVATLCFLLSCHLLETSVPREVPIPYFRPEAPYSELHKSQMGIHNPDPAALLSEGI